jgi:lysyl-tRNA synthetase class II
MKKSKFSVSTLHESLVASRSLGRKLFLSISDLEEALTAFLRGEISKEEIADWAEFYDANDDVVFETDEIMSTILFEISSPDINGWLDEARAEELRLSLTKR